MIGNLQTTVQGAVRGQTLGSDASSGVLEERPVRSPVPVFMDLIPVTLDEAKEFVRRHHRHNKPDVSWKFGVGLEVNGELVGVAVAGRCKARVLDKKGNIEITRVCVHDTRNGNSRLYGAILRAAKSLGYKMAYTYTLQSESGASLKASGWILDAELEPRASWSCPSRPRVQTNMFGEEQRPTEAKIRWKHPL